MIGFLAILLDCLQGLMYGMYAGQLLFFWFVGKGEFFLSETS